MKRASKAKSAPARKGVGAVPVPAKKARPAEQKAALGLPFGELEVLCKQLDLSMSELTSKLGFNRFTRHRRQGSDRLTVDESAEVVRFARLLGQAVHLFGSLEEARRWLKQPQAELGGAIPLDCAQSEDGARQVESLLGRLQFQRPT